MHAARKVTGRDVTAAIEGNGGVNSTGAANGVFMRLLDMLRGHEAQPWGSAAPFACDGANQAVLAEMGRRLGLDSTRRRAVAAQGRPHSLHKEFQVIVGALAECGCASAQQLLLNTLRVEMDDPKRERDLQGKGP